MVDTHSYFLAKGKEDRPLDRMNSLIRCTWVHGGEQKGPVPIITIQKK